MVCDDMVTQDVASGCAEGIEDPLAENPALKEDQESYLNVQAIVARLHSLGEQQI